MSLFGNFVGFSEKKNTNKIFKTFNPIKNSYNQESYSIASDKDVQNALELASNYYEADYPPSHADRVLFFNLLINFLKDDQEKLKNSYCKETGLSQQRFTTEFNRTINTINKFTKLINTPSWKEISSNLDLSTNIRIEKHRVALGPVLVFGASNFALAYSTAGGDTIAALAAGCPVIVKSHPFHAGTSYLVAKAIIKANQKSKLPEGFFSHLQDDSHHVAQTLISSENIKAISFTGSLNGGKSIFDLAMKRKTPIPVFSEMGSTNPIILFKDKIKENKSFWIDKISTSICNDAGQFCTKPGIIFYPKNNTDNNFIELLTKKVIETKPIWMVHPSILKRYNALIYERKKQSNGLLYQNTKNKDENKAKPTLLSIDIKNFISNPSLQEEVFGPFCLLISYSSIEELKKGLKKIEGQLTFSFIGSEREFEQHKPLINIGINRAGRIIFNDVPTGVQTTKHMHHGGPYPASTDSRFTSVGTDSILRFTRPIAIQTRQS
ncbi:MAG: aldehyde dehydrogenase family protein [Crocinitomicaceae bacterium]|nr:aldehyde dehydrogenase family protein [Crocinitomicaceae bacterium]